MYIRVFLALSSDLHYKKIKAIKSYTIMNYKIYNPKAFLFLYNCLGHLGSTIMCRIVKSSRGHLLNFLKILLSYEKVAQLVPKLN